MGRDNCNTIRETFTFEICCDFYWKIDGIVEKKHIVLSSRDPIRDMQPIGRCVTE